MKKRDGSINRLLYTLLALCVFIIMGMGVFIVNAYGGTQPSVMGHSVGEMNWGDSIPSLRADSFEAGSINLGGVPRTSWPVSGITSETDPTVIASVKDGVSWAELSSIPAGFADGVDNVGTSSQGCNWVGWKCSSSIVISKNYNELGDLVSTFKLSFCLYCSSNVITDLKWGS